jgi:hypothetical protein
MRSPHVSAHAHTRTTIPPLPPRMTARCSKTMTVLYLRCSHVRYKVVLLGEGCVGKTSLVLR